MPNYGNAPYEESAFKSALRLLAAGASGAGRAVAGDPFASFGNAFGAQQQASSAAQQAAQAYAQKQQEFEERARHNRESEAYTNALIERQKKPEPVPKVDIHSASPDQWQQYLDRVEQEAKAKAAGRPVKVGASAKAPKPPAPMKFPRRVPAGVTEQAIIDSINESTDPESLIPYMTGRGGADTTTSASTNLPKHSAWISSSSVTTIPPKVLK